MKLKVVPPRNVAVLQLTLPKQGRVKVFVVLRMRVLADESTNVDVLAGSVIEHHIDCDIVVAYKAYYLQDVLVHSFCVIFSCPLHMDVYGFMLVREELEYNSKIFVDGRLGSFLLVVCL